MKVAKKALSICCCVVLWLGVATPGISGVDHSQDMYWTEMDSGTTENLYDIWGSGSDNVFAVGSNGTILHYDGISWSSMSSPVTEDIYAIWGRSAWDVYAVGVDGTQLHFNGTTWSTMGAIPNPAGIVSDVHGSSTETYCATYGAIAGGPGGGEVMRLYGNWEARSSERFCAPTDYSCINARSSDRFNAIYVQESTGHVYVGGYGAENGTPSLWRKIDSNGFANYNYNFNLQAILGIWGIDNTVYFFGVDYTPGQNDHKGVIYREVNGYRYPRNLFTDVGSIHDAWGTAGDNVFFAANNGQILHFNGNSWVGSIHVTDDNLRGIWGSSDQNVFAVGGNGTILHYDANNQNVGPTLTLPANHSTQSGTAVHFYWTSVPWADSYQLQISETEDMSRLVLDYNVGSVTDMNISGFANYGRPYFWKVLANDGYGQNIGSETFRFENGTAISPILITPGYGENVPGSSVNFLWHQFVDATGYYFQLAADANYTNILAQGMVYDTQINLAGFGNNGATYYWRVLDYDGENFGDYWSASNPFVNGTP